MAEVTPFHALRYDEGKAGPLADLVAPPYDVIDAEARSAYLARSPYNVVHLTLPDSEEQAARDLADWREGGVLREEEPAIWWVAQDYVGPDGVARTREGFAASVEVRPYGDGVVLPHERTHAGPREGRLRLLRAVRTQLEPILLLYDTPAPAGPAGAPDLEASVGGVTTRVWRVQDAGPYVEPLRDAQLLIADGHHRYETAVAFREEEPSATHTFAVLVSSRAPGLEIFPTHRVVQRVGEVPGTPVELDGELPGVVLYRDGRSVLVDAQAELDPQVVELFAPEGVSYTPSREEAIAAVDRGEAEAAFLLRPTTVEQVTAVARRGETMPQKSTFFYPKLTSGLLFHPL